MLQILQVEQMKDYIHQSLAYIAYTTTVATQKVSFSLFEDMIIIQQIRLTRASSSSATILIVWDQLLENWRSRFFLVFSSILKEGQ